MGIYCSCIPVRGCLGLTSSSLIRQDSSESVFNFRASKDSQSDMLPMENPNSNARCLSDVPSSPPVNLSKPQSLSNEHGSFTSVGASKMMGSIRFNNGNEKINVDNFFFRGVSIKILREVLEEWNKVPVKKSFSGGRQMSNGEKMIECIVKERCADLKCSYVELLGRDNSYQDDIGECNVFISHAWKYDFKDLMSAVEEFESEHQNVKLYYFLDLLAVNQFNPLSDLNNLQDMVSRCEYFLLVLLPWNKPLPLTRMWCIFEIACALSKQKRSMPEMIVSMPKKQEKLFENKLMSGDDGSKDIIEVFKNLDSSNAEASRLEDKRDISKKITEDMGGFERVDQRVGGCLRFWLLKVVDKTNKNWPSEKRISEERANFLLLAGGFLTFQGKHQEALDMWTECLELRRTSKKDNSDPVVVVKSNLAVAYDNLGMHGSALTLRKELVLVKESVLGQKDPSTLEMKDSLAVSYDNVKKYSMALKLKREVLSIREQLYGKEHNSVLNSKNNIAFSLRQLGFHEEVHNINQEVYEIRLKQNGPQDPNTLLAASNLASSYNYLGKHEKALRKYKEVYMGYAKIMGPDSEDTFDSLSNLIASCRKLAKFKEAKRYAEQGSEWAEKRFGSNHRRVKEFIETIDYCSEMLKDEENVAKLQETAKREAEANSPESVNVKAILSYQKKLQGVKPEKRINVPPEGIELSDFLILCDPKIKGNLKMYWVENGSRQKLRRIPHKKATVWVKSMLSCNIIQTYLPKVRTKYQSVDICLRSEGSTKEELIQQVDENLDPSLYEIENRSRQSVKFVMPGTTVLWLHKINR